MLKSSIIILEEFENIFCDKMKTHYGEPLYLITLYYFFLNCVPLAYIVSKLRSFTMFLHLMTKHVFFHQNCTNIVRLF
jgi:hypothetical protein